MHALSSTSTHGSAMTYVTVRSSSGYQAVPSIARVRPGDRVSLRVRSLAGPRDVVGELVAAGPTTLSVRRRDGEIEHIAVDDVEAGRVVPPGPERTIGVAELQRIAAEGWRAPTVDRLGGWLLREAGGVTGRANSALPLGDPGVELPSAVATVTRWYTERELPPMFQLPSAEVDPALEPLLDNEGWVASPGVHVMTAALGAALRRGGGDVPVSVDDVPSDGWLARWRASADPDSARRLLTNHDRVVFGSVVDGGEVVATARASVDGRWTGLFCVAVAASHRRQGLGRAVSLVVLRRAVELGARFSYLQTETDNAAAITLYTDLGYRVHHDYVYRSTTASPRSLRGDFDEP